MDCSTFSPGPLTHEAKWAQIHKIWENPPEALPVGRPRENIFHRCGEEGGAKSSSTGLETLNFAGTD